LLIFMDGPFGWIILRRGISNATGNDADLCLRLRGGQASSLRTSISAGLHLADGRLKPR
jgi:hypothetical protein